MTITNTHEHIVAQKLYEDFSVIQKGKLNEISESGMNKKA